MTRGRGEPRPNLERGDAHAASRMSSGKFFRHVAIPVAAVAIAFAIRGILLAPLVGTRGPVITFFLAVVASVAYGGLIAGIVATILSAMVASYFFYEPSGSLYPTTLTDAVLLGYYIMTGVVVSIMGELLNRSRSRESARAEEIAAEREKLRISLASIGDAVISVDASRRVTFLNPAAEELIGRRRHEAEGNHIDEILHLVDRSTHARLPSPADRALDPGRHAGPASDPVLISADGTERPIDESASPIRDALGSLVGAILVFRDVTEKKRAELAIRSSEERLRLATSAADIGIWDFNPSSGAVTCDGRARRHLGLSDGANVRYEDLLAAIHPEERERIDAAISSSLSPDRTELVAELRIHRPHSSECWVEVKGMALPAGPDEPPRLIGTITDITSRKRSEETLKDADRRKNEFLATLAHELRNPLAPIRTGLEILNLARSEEERREAGAVMERQIGHMVRLVDDLLDISRITSGKIELKKERVDLKEILAGAIEASRPFLASGHHSLITEIPDRPFPLDADPARLVQVFNNLLTNAAKYTPERGRVRISAREVGGKVAVSVQDTGVGIKSEILPHVFEMFTQGEQDPRRAQEGLGIGLTLVQTLTQLHGGVVEVESRGPGTGSTFTVRLPLSSGGVPAEETSPAPRAQARAEASTAAKVKILVVDDNLDAARTLSLLLRHYGHETLTVHTGNEAIAACDDFRPDLVFLDIGLPELDGHEVARWIRSRRDLPQPILVAVTGWGSEQDRELSRQAGFDHHLTKPVEAAKLGEILGLFKARVADGS